MFNQPIRNGTTRIWDIDSGKELHQFDGEFLGFSPDEKKIVTANEDGTVRIWILGVNGTGVIVNQRNQAPTPTLGNDIFDAVRKGTTQDVKSHLSSGVNVNITDSDGDTPLHVAARLGRLDVVKLLVGEGANVDAKNNSGYTPLGVAESRTNREIVEFLSNINSTSTGGIANQSPQPRKAGDRAVLTCKNVKYPFRWCPPGTFMMGSPNSETGRQGNIERQYRVTLSQGFWMLETPVTQEMWESIMEPPTQRRGTQNEKLPQTRISWNDCQKYVSKLNDLGAAPPGYCFSLPTEAQWEYACRAGTTTPFHFGRILNLNLNKAEAHCSASEPIEVGSFPANAWGLYDMHGNVWEWCLDWYGDYPRSSVTDPIGASSALERVLRGGSFRSKVHACRSAARGHNKPSAQLDEIGFRLALVREETPDFSVAKKLAEQGDASAQFDLGICYARGTDGVPQDYSEAAKWFRKSAEQGIVKAQFNLGMCYDNGYGVPKNIGEAIKWYREAEKGGHERAKAYRERLEK